MKKILNSVAIIIPTLLIAVAVSYVSAQGGWVAPTQPPPDGNVPAPINVGAATQSKLGAIQLNTSLVNPATFGLDVFGKSRFFGNLEIGTTTTPATLKIVDGNQGAGKVLTSDATGLARWADGGGGTVNQSSVNPAFLTLAMGSIISYGEAGNREPYAYNDARNWIKVVANSQLVSGNKYGVIVVTYGDSRGSRILGSTLGTDSGLKIYSRCYNSGGNIVNTAEGYTFLGIPTRGVGEVSYQGTFVYNPSETYSSYIQASGQTYWGLWPYPNMPTDINFQKIAERTIDCSDSGKGGYAIYIYDYDFLKSTMDFMYRIVGNQYYKFNDPLSSDPNQKNNIWFR